MNLFDRISAWLGATPPQKNTKRDDVDVFHTTVSRARHAMRSGKYEEALAALNDVLARPPATSNTLLLMNLQLSRVAALCRLQRFDVARDVLATIEREPFAGDAPVRSAHLHIGRGMIAQANADPATAETHYEGALALAKQTSFPSIEGRAAGHLADMYLRDGNASYAAHLLQQAIPKLSPHHDMEMRCYFTGLHGLALIEVGRTTEGQQRLGQALRLAENMEYREFEILWRGALAVEAAEKNHFEEVHRHLLLVLAHVGVGVHYGDHLLALCRISKACYRLGDVSAALDYAQQAVDLLDEDTAPRLRAMAHAALGVAARITGDYTLAVAHLTQADDDYDQLSLTPADYPYTELLRNIGAAYTETGDYAAAMAAYERALDYAQQNELHFEIAGTQRDIGIHYMRRGGYQEAVSMWTQALRRYESQEQHAAVARLYCDIANVRRQFGQAKRAMKDYEQALMLLNSFDDLETRGLVLANAATAYVDHGDLATADAFFTEAIQIAQKMRDRPTEARRRGNYGWFLLNTGRAREALDMLRYALRQSENLDLTLQAAVQTDNIGLALDELGDHQQAIAHHGRAWQMLGDSDEVYWKAMISANLAHSLIAGDQLDDAATLLDSALEIARQIERSDVIVRALCGMVRLALKRDGLSGASDLAAEAVTLAEALSSRRLLADALILRSELYARAGQMDSARADWERAAQLLTMLHLDVSVRQPQWKTG